VLPLGFRVFGVGIFVTAAYSLVWIPPQDGRELFLLALAFVAPIQAALVCSPERRARPSACSCSRTARSSSCSRSQRSSRA